MSVELRPRDMDTWALVQSLAMNPRIRATVELQKPFSMLLAFLENRWQTENRKLVSFQFDGLKYNLAIQKYKSKNLDFLIKIVFKLNIFKHKIASVNKYIELKHKLKLIKNLKES